MPSPTCIKIKQVATDACTFMRQRMYHDLIKFEIGIISKKKGYTHIRISSVMHFSNLVRCVHEKYVDFA